MSTCADAKLYSEHAKYFRTLLGRQWYLALMAELPGGSLLLLGSQWGWQCDRDQTVYDVPESVAVAAVTEYWWKVFAAAAYWIDVRKDGDVLAGKRGASFGTYSSLPHALCAIAKQEAEAKLEREKPQYLDLAAKIEEWYFGQKNPTRQTLLGKLLEKELGS